MTGRPTTGPDFLVIGAQRAGTTWLHRVLRQHPALWLTPVKELHYFDKPGIERTITDANERQRVGRKLRASFVAWQIRYWFGRRNDAWYASLFRDARARGLIAGEITPAYATLPVEILHRIRAMNPAVRLVYIMRDPLDRAWSAVHNAAKKGNASVGAVGMKIAKARHQGAAARSDYAGTIERLESVFDAGQIHYCFFEDLRDRPDMLVGELLRFLGVAPLPLELPRAINVAAGAKAVSPEFAREMAGDYLPMLERLCRRFEGPPHAWRDRCVLLLAGQDSAIDAAPGAPAS